MNVAILDKIQKSVKTCPKEANLSNIKSLKLSLKPHQKRALAWLLWREKQKPSGGIFADDMGLGKTLTMISLIIKSIEIEGRRQSQDGIFIGGTLVVCPASLLNHWKNEVLKRTSKKEAHISVEVFHGNDREAVSKRLASFDIVVTTYATLLSEKQKKGIIFEIKWRRLVLDEGHQVRNQETGIFGAVCSVKTTSRWAMTGTPIHNSDLDMHSMMKFLEFAPFKNMKVWKEWLSNQQNLKIVISSVMLRRTKEELGELGELKELPIKVLEVLKVELKKEEMKLYREFEKLPTSGKNNIIFVKLLRLRQICCHPFLITSECENGSKEAETGDLLEKLKGLNIKDNQNDPTSSKNSIFSEGYRSSKIEILFTRLKQIIVHGDKTVVISQWATFLKIIASHLEQEQVRFLLLEGTTAVDERITIVDEFNDPTNTAKVLLLTLTAGGVGLNLIGGNHLFLMDLHWNPQQEKQAQDRIYRMGQNKPVFVYKFLTVNTIEEKVQVVQDKKLEIADSFFAEEKREKLSSEDLKLLFYSKK